ncbi:MAG: hypothetical protein JWO02_2505 [Solirubrobacterales bacterium]|nr:hypothetical protein [Solirubrobacterales bacterium]
MSTFGAEVRPGGADEQRGGDVDWAFGPGAVSWEIMRNPAVFVVGILREAILLTLHLPFAAAATDHDGVHSDPIKRFRTIARYAYSATYGTKADAELVSGYVRRRHTQVVGVEPVSGEPYRANSDYELVLTQALLTSSWIAAYEAINGRLSDRERDQFVVEQQTAGALLGIRPHHLPSTMPELEAFLAKARLTWAAGEQAREVLKPFASGVYPEGSVIGSLPPVQRRAAAWVVRLLTDIATSTMGPEDRALLAIDRRPELRFQVAVRASRRSLARFLGSERGLAIFDRFLKPDVAKIMRRARDAEAAAGGYGIAAASFVPPNPEPFVVHLEDRVENMPG